MGNNDQWIIGGIIAAVACVCITIFLIVFFTVVHGGGNCDGGAFQDITSPEGQLCTTVQRNVSGTLQNVTECFDTMVEFYMEDEILSVKSQMNILDKDENEIGRYFEKIGTSIRRQFRFEFGGNVQANIEKDLVSLTSEYTLTRCDDELSNVYRIEERFLTIGTTEYEIYKDGTLIGQSSQRNFFTAFKPDITIEDMSEQPMAYMGRDIQISLHRDKWTVVNLQPQNIDSYVVGFIAYITTVKESEN